MSRKKDEYDQNNQRYVNRYNYQPYKERIC